MVPLGILRSEPPRVLFGGEDQEDILDYTSIITE
jgi:hypothetical protein